MQEKIFWTGTCENRNVMILFTFNHFCWRLGKLFTECTFSEYITFALVTKPLFYDMGLSLLTAQGSFNWDLSSVGLPPHRSEEPSREQAS